MNFHNTSSLSRALFIRSPSTDIWGMRTCRQEMWLDQCSEHWTSGSGDSWQFLSPPWCLRPTDRNLLDSGQLFNPGPPCPCSLTFHSIHNMFCWLAGLPLMRRSCSMTFLFLCLLKSLSSIIQSLKTPAALTSFFLWELSSSLNLIRLLIVPLLKFLSATTLIMRHCQGLHATFACILILWVEPCPAYVVGNE